MIRMTGSQFNPAQPWTSLPCIVSPSLPRLQISERLHRALQLPGYTPERVAAMYSQLARVCLETMRVGFADLVLERAEARSLPVSMGLGALHSGTFSPTQEL